MLADLWESAVVRTALAPAAAAFGAAVAIRNRLYDRGVLTIHDTAIPTISVGNLTVGGTGKTPIASYLAQALRARGRRPAIVLRGYRGGDEVLVHRMLTSDALVIANLDRLGSVAKAAAMGSDVAILDDGFQHRRVARVADIVLVSADAWAGSHALLPVGPWREPRSALARATLVIVTRKAVDAAAASAVVSEIGGAVPTAIAALSADALRGLDGETRSLASLRGTRVHAVAAIGDPAAFFAQLRATGADIVTHAFRDHHAYGPDDVARLVRAADGETVVCTLKDAVKLGPLWPRQREAPWYVSQRVTFDRGIEAVQLALDAT
ncbi:MAG TPA: tetraacyldisaccharide 4'-kinase [Gemmatimonadaceae bacterium]|nr:tetraacyldisaccharide 4'-kinase [Gemmatimonadaceae bacterium]